MITTFWQECQTLSKWQVCCENADRANFSEGTIYFRDGLNTTLVRPGHNTESIKQTLRCLAEHYVDNLEGRQMMISTFRVV